MPFATHSNESSGGFEQPFSQAGVLQVVAPELPTPIVATIGAGGNWQSGFVYSLGYRYLTVAVTSSQAGALNITQYLDPAFTIARPVTTTPVVAATPLIVDIADLKPFVGYNIQITNTSGSTANITKFAILMSAG